MFLLAALATANLQAVTKLEPDGLVVYLYNKVHNCLLGISHTSFTAQSKSVSCAKAYSGGSLGVMLTQALWSLQV